MEKQERSSEKIAGGILGFVIGDILAFPLRQIDYNARKKYFPVEDIVEPFDFDKQLEEGNYHHSNLMNKVNNWYPAGFYSFYSQQLLLVFDSIYQKNDIDLEDISQKLVKYSFPRDRTAPLGVFRGYNRPFYDSIQNIANGMPLKLCGSTHCIGDSFAKLIPIALFLGKQNNLIKDRSIDVTLLTNRDHHSVAGAAAIAYAVSQASTKSTYNVEDEINRTADFVRNTENHAMDRFRDFFPEFRTDKNFISNSIRELHRLKNEPVEHGVEYYKNLARQNNLKESSAVVTTGIGLLLFIKNIDSFDEAIRNSLALDIDIEIITPIVGALSGSLHGLEKISEQAKNLVKTKEDICIKAENLHKETERPKITNFFIKELELSDEQYAKKQLIMEKIEEKIPANA